MSLEARLTSNTFEVPDDLEAVYELMYSRGITDGLPVIPPTEERVRKMVEGAGLPADHLVARVPVAYGEATVEVIAVNAVMAGCRPEYMPVVMAAVEAVCREEFNLTAVGTTTSSAGVALVVNGPIRNKLDINSRWNCMGPGWRGNATIGRALNLVLLNAGGLRPVDIDKATHGYPGKYTFCFAEFEEESRWEPLHVERGFRPSDSTVTAFSVGSTVCTYGPMPDVREWLQIVADVMHSRGSYRFSSGRGEVVFVITPAATRIMTEAGLTKGEVKALLHEYGAIPESRLLANHPRDRLGDVLKGGKVYPVPRPEDVVLLVAGRGSAVGPPFEVTFLEPFANSRSVTVAVREPA